MRPAPRRAILRVGGRMIIRAMAIADYERAYGLWSATEGVGLRERDDSRGGIAKYLSRNPATCFVAEDRGEIVGTILCGHDGRRGFIYHMAVAEKERAKGIGAKLLNRAAAALKGEGVTKIALVVKGYNESGNRFWENRGYAARGDLVYRDIALTELKRTDT